MGFVSQYRSASLLALALGAPAMAWGQGCAAPLQSSARAVSHLPGGIPFEVPDQLQLYYDEASELVDSDPAACLAIVAKMNALIARYMPGGSGGGAGAAPGPVQRAEEAADGPSADDLLADAQVEDSERLARRIERATDEEAGHLRAVGEYRDAARAYAGAMRAFAVSRRSDPAELTEVDAAVAQIDVISREFERVVITNAPDDVMHAKLEDAVRRVEEARRALERAWKRYHDRKEAEDDFLAPLGPQEIELAPLVRDDFLAPLGDAGTRAAQTRLRKAERDLKRVRNSWDPHIHRHDRPFLDMKDGYKDAYRAEHDRFAEELKAFDATIDAYLPDRIAAFTRRRAELWEKHEQRLDAVFERFAIL
jgi:hypothetical protein